MHESVGLERESATRDTSAPPQVLVLIGLFLALLLSVAHTLYSLYSLRKLSYDDDAEMAEDKETGILGGVGTG